MKTSFVLGALMAGMFLPVCLHGQAPVASAEVEVRDVKFTRVRAPRGGDNWLEAAVELSVRAVPGGGVAGRWADRVGVTLSLGIERREGGFSFYQASTRLVAVEAGSVLVRFYLPPEIVRREQINSDPYAYLVELEMGGNPLPGGAASSSLRNAAALASFKDRVRESAGQNDGVLVPQYDSPFEHEYGAETPSFFRHRG